MSYIRAVIADDSAMLRTVLHDILENNGVSVVGAARNGKEAVELVAKLRPDILILDCEMPVMNGLDALNRIMTETPLPVFMFSSLTREGAAVTIKALELGAVDFLLKPVGGALSVETIASELITKIKFIVIRDKFRKSSPDKGRRMALGAQVGTLANITHRHLDIIAMGSSMGGVQAAVQLIPKLPANTKPIVWVQHMPPNFTKSFAERLDTLSAMHVVEAMDGEVVKDGVCYLAPGGVQMRVVKSVARTVIRLGGTEKISGHCPSCDELFTSVSEQFSENAMGIILTGMGEDGAKGLQKMHSRGSFVVGQSERTCIVYGMPRAAFMLGAVDVQLDLNDIAKAVTQTQGLTAAGA